MTTAFSASGAVKSPSVSTPDFAYPEKVSANAQRSLEAALASGDDIAMLRSLMNLTLAQNAISSDRMPELLERIDSLTQAASSPDIQSLLYLLQARIYSDIYNSERYSISERPTPPGDRPSDYKVWSARQFGQCIIELCNAAMADERSLLRKPLADYKTIITANTLTYTFYPRLYDFVAASVISMLENLDTTEASELAEEFRTQRLGYSEDSAAPYAVDRISDILAGNGDENEKYSQLIDLYDRLASSQYRIEVALAMSSVAQGNDRLIKEVYPILTGLIKKYPRYPRFNCLVNEVTRISQPELSVQVPVAVAPGRKFTIRGHSTNLTSATVKFYRIPDSKSPSSNYYRLTNRSLLSEVASVSLDFAGTVPFNAESTVDVTLDEPGLYIAIPSSAGMARPQNESYRIIHCSKLSTGIISFDKASALVVDPVTGCPISDAEIMWTPEQKASRLVATTDSAGLGEINLATEAQLQAVKGLDKYSPVVWYYPRRNLNEQKITDIQIFTGLSIYHLGDSVDWAVMAYSADGKRYRPCDGRQIRVMLRNANRETVDTIEAGTDDFGRAQGKFVLPENGLTGYFSIVAEVDERTGIGTFMVSDYKLPTFEVKVANAATGVPSVGAVTISGSAMTYSGMPVSGAEVNIILSKRQMWWRWNNSQTFVPVTVTATTDSNGNWSAVIESEKLEKAGKNAWFNAEVRVTSPAGEMQQADYTFAMGTPLRIRSEISGSLDVTDSVALDIKVVNTADSVVEASVSYDLLGGKDFKSVVRSGVLETPDSTVVDWRDIDPATYRLRLSLDGDTIESEICIYRPDVNKSPSRELLWTPDRELKFGSDTEQDILIGTLEGKSYVLYTLWDGDGLYEQRWLELDGGLHTIHVKGPHGATDLTATFIVTRDMTNQRLDVKLKSPVNPRDLKLKIESMRDKLLPGTDERWTLRITNSLDIPVEAALMAEMYNKALDALSQPRQWQLDIVQPYSRSLDWSNTSMSISLSSWLRGNISTLRCTDITEPAFDLYGLSFSMQTFRRYNGMMRSMATGAVANDMVMMKSAAQAPIPTAKADFVTEESADEGETDAGSTERTEVDYRDADVTLAFFRPMIRTERDGTAVIEFTVPQANATWAFRALAYTADMRNTSAEATVISQKPVMVKPNVPRFLRQGDSAVILTAVMNASDKYQTINVTIEATSTDGDKIAVNTETVALAPQGTAYVPLTVEAGESAGIIMTARAETDDFCDGERDFIPIYAATTPVIGSRPFYMAPGSGNTEISLPAAENAVTTVEFCDNPVWYVVTALPGLRQGDINSAIAAADAIFSCAVAEGILKTYPSVATALKEWSESDRSEVALTSMLERNEDMKTVLLNATPWMMDARSQTERMERLAIMFDRKAVRDTYSKAIAILQKLMRGDGGWAWVEQCTESSVWITCRVLSILGRLNMLGYFPENAELQAIVSRAVGYVDNKVVEQIANRPQSDMTDFAILRTMYPGVKQSAAVKSIISAAVQHCVADWQQWPLASKPQVALLLYRNNYRSVAEEILGSMTEFMERSPEKGCWFPSVENTAYGYLSFTANALEAYKLITPGSPEVDGLFQWLVLQKQATEWGNGAPASDIIATILSGAGNVLDDAGKFHITVNGRDMDLTDVDRRLGYVRTNVDTGTLPVNFVFDKTGDAPAWGSVMRRSTETITEVAAAGVEDLQIEKRILLPDGKTEISVGDRLTVQLTIRVGRNMNYVTVVDNRAAGLEPVDQTPFTRFCEGVVFYMEPRTTATNMFVTTMPKGTYVLTYDVIANNAGEFASGLATIQCQQAPELTARSNGSKIEIVSKKL